MISAPAARAVEQQGGQARLAGGDGGVIEVVDVDHAQVDPTDGGGVVVASAELTTSCTDGEIDATLAPYGEWVEIEGYGLVWRPYTTAVGVDFTPYETCGSWVWTEWGWTFACSAPKSCLARSRARFSTTSTCSQPP